MLHKLYPNMYVPSILDINPDELKKHGIRAVLLDLDNTIVPRDCDECSFEVKSWLAELLGRGFKLCIVSNNGTTRVNNLAGSLQIPCVVRAVKPLPKAFTRALDILEATPAETAVVGDQIFTDILGGNSLGLFTILVVPLQGKEFWATKHINRRLEKLVLSRISRRVSHKDKKYYVK